MIYGYATCDSALFPCVYFIRDGMGNIKIGKTKDVLSRLNTLQTANAHELSIHFVMKVETMRDAEVLEKELHDKFDYCHICGEWFRENDVIAYTEQYEIHTSKYVFKGLST